MIFSGAFPKNAALDAAIGSLKGRFAYPFSYGYALVGKVSAVGTGVPEESIGRTCFAFHPHQDRAVVPLADCHWVPDGVSPEAALFLPQAEAALNLVMDGAPLIGERVLVFGQGVVGPDRGPAGGISGAPGCRRARAAARAREPGHRRHGRSDDAGSCRRPSRPNGADLVYELSGNPAALDRAIEAAGFDGRIVVGSWYGAGTQPVELGGRFHRNRLRLISSQVSTVNPALAGRWSKARRMELAWRMVRQLEPQRLVGPSFALAECQQAFEAASARRDGVMQVIFHTDEWRRAFLPEREIQYQLAVTAISSPSTT